MISTQHRAVLWMMGWTLSFTLAMTANRLLKDIPLPLLIWSRSIFILLFILPFLKRRAIFQHFTLNFLRGLCMSGAIFCSYMTYRVLPFHKASLVGTLQPFWIMICAVVLLKERVHWKRWGLVVTAYTGIAILFYPDILTHWTISKDLLMALTGNILAAMGVIIGRVIVKHQGNKITSLFYGNLIPFLVYGCYLYPSSSLSLFTWGCIAFISVCAALSQLCYLSALKLAPASFLAPFEHVRFCLSVPLSFFLFQETFSWEFYLGGFLILASALWLANLDRKSAYS